MEEVHEAAGLLEDDEKHAILSQRDYRPTPYQLTQWEVVGERISNDNFMSMDLVVLRDQRSSTDPMFDAFDSDREPLLAGTVFSTPGGDLQSRTEESEDAAPAFDIALFEAELDARYEAGRQAGIAEGAAGAEAQRAADYERLSAQLQQLGQQVQEEVQNRLAEIEERGLRLSLEIARKLLHTTVEMKPEYIVGIIRKGVTSLGAAKPIRIRVSHQDYEFIEVVGLPPELTPGELGVTYVADPMIHSGCVIESDFGELSLELDKMWEEVVRAITSGGA